MIRREQIDINNINDYEILNNIVDKNLLDDNLVSNLQKYLGNKCQKIIYEYPYYDKDYLSTFYTFYAMKMKEYSKKCARLIFIGAEREVLGYMSLRPTPAGTRIGKTYLEPIYLKENAGGKECHIILSYHKSHVNNEELFLQCFPWMCQQQDITVCAHIAMWSLLRHFSSLSSIYAEVLSGDIAEKVEHYERKIPSPGLTPPQMSSMLLNYGFSTMVHRLNRFHTFLDEIIAYIDSGIPLIGVISKREHAVSIIGYTIEKEKILENISGSMVVENTTNIILHSRLVSDMIVNDDQRFPYKIVPRYLSLKNNTALEENESDEVEYIIPNIDCIIVPFYKRIQLSYSDVYARIIALSKTGDFKWIADEQGPSYLRIFLAPVNRLKAFVAEHWENCNNVAYVLGTLEMPKFVWCGEFADAKNYKKDKVDSFIVIDSTASGFDDACLFIRDKEKYRYFSDGEIKEERFKEKPNDSKLVWESFSENWERI